MDTTLITSVLIVYYAIGLFFINAMIWKLHGRLNFFDIIVSFISAWFWGGLVLCYFGRLIKKLWRYIFR